MIRKSEKKGHKPTDDNQLRPLMTVKAGGSHKASRKQGQVDKSTCQCTNLIKIGPLFPFLFFRQQEHYYRSAYALFHFGIRPESIFLWVCHNGTLIPCDLLVFNQFKQKWWIRPNRMDHYGNLTRTEEGRKFWTTPKITNWVKFLFTNGPIPVSFCLFLFFPHYNFNNANWKSKDGVLGIWTRGRRIVGTGKNSKNWTLYVSLNKIRQKIHLNANLCVVIDIDNLLVPAKWRISYSVGVLFTFC